MAEGSIRTERLAIETRGDAEMVDITRDVQGVVREAGMNEGQVLLFCVGSTGGLTTIEYEPGLIRDFPDMFDRLIPKDIRYRHDDTWHDGNGHSHCRASLLGPSLTIPVQGGQMLLGTWQQIIFVDFDNKPRSRELVIQLCE
ncbi:MAG: secondary thiamine-phosphate synthase enzyme YjbQ [Candidatus Thalassarchaeaceae archaeon]|jgi:secondary thiamine-phosphate synthase enzyme|nr:secondary thiamine-phosphate synthase enzyme [Euryarchaeota archaeon]MBV14531.1 secondary thiamine-phosphate synthase enzyme [Actinomycetota bacterium]MDP6220740.1 secondary thiamine-phosphate synthase enzyme YjbQ [Candidatus Thalassarchaeaceae archaeon]MDP7091356.1 secondary thiamine-phosphate synthase enzyme YjbQ [Candidatus Thalassarchaeaceae archaeon]MDP7256554.1 secondary thiamine-phosphate synthase enzyme YjbQ [Candidatus Thalassarchaeaceae archaeon]|tara:strand:+ start:10962 stop:11387 length:426 start_codon:yes stop_codon:yes gene_type:complete